MKKKTVEMPYPGSVISVNHYLGRNKAGDTYVKAEASAWMRMLGWQIKTSHIEDWKLPVTVIVSGTFRDTRSCPDIHNLLKCTCDAIEEVTGINDRNYKTETKEPVIDNTTDPVLKITIKESE